jgi:putative membrane protein
MKPFCYLGRLVLGGALICLPLAMTAQTNTTPRPKAGTQEPDLAQGNRQNASPMTASDKTFVREAAQGGMAEVQLGQLAEQKATNPDVKKFGERMVTDHSKANKELEQVAERDGIPLPKKLDAKDQMLKDRLEKLSGPAFDRAYMQNMVKDHQHDVTQFEHEARDGQNTDVKEFATQTTPILKSHLREAERVEPETTKTSANTGMR